MVGVDAEGVSADVLQTTIRGDPEDPFEDQSLDVVFLLVVLDLRKGVSVDGEDLRTHVVIPDHLHPETLLRLTSGPDQMEIVRDQGGIALKEGTLQRREPHLLGDPAGERIKLHAASMWVKLMFIG